MTCENCKTRVERYLNDSKDVSATVNLKKKGCFDGKEFTDAEIISPTEKTGYPVNNIKQHKRTLICTAPFYLKLSLR